MIQISIADGVLTVSHGGKEVELPISKPINSADSEFIKGVRTRIKEAGKGKHNYVISRYLAEQFPEDSMSMVGFMELYHILLGEAERLLNRKLNPLSGPSLYTYMRNCRKGSKFGS